MKKVLFLAICLSLGPAMCESSELLTGRFGVGVNWGGLQAQYGFEENWIAEGKIQFASNNTLAGARLYRLFSEVPRMLFEILPYIGTEFDWVFSDYLKGGVLTGVFGGVELLPSRHIGIGMDIGIYYENLWSNLGHVVDVGLILNLGVTFYF